MSTKPMSEKLEEEIELQPILQSLTARPPLDVTLDEETEARLPLIFGGMPGPAVGPHPPVR